jgi:ABC-type branched-subunit amino acid transport system ATPase component
MSDVPKQPEPREGHSDPEVVLEVQGVTKSFGPLSVLRGIDLTLHAGEVLGLVGDNGAGKSTLVKILSGLYSPDAGRILVNGNEVRFRSVEDTTDHGIETVYQDLALVPELPVYLNLFLNHELTHFGPLRLLDKRRMRQLAQNYLDDINVYVPNVDTETGQLSGGQRQAVAVARATRADARILLLDEPLASMGVRESRLIIDLVKGLASSRSVSIIIIDHNYAHLFQLCDRVNVMQGGRIIIDRLVRETSVEELTELMVSRYRTQLQHEVAVAPPPRVRPPPPPPESGKQRGRLAAAGVVVLAIVIAVVAIVASQSGHHSSTGHKTTTTTAATTTTIGPPAHKVVLAQRGSGIAASAPFVVDRTPWILTWAYNCGANPGNFIVTVRQGKSKSDTNDKRVNELGAKGSGTQGYVDKGEFNLAVTSECSWSLRVTNG